jgi:hypothetical protein
MLPLPEDEYYRELEGFRQRTETPPETKAAADLLIGWILSI